MQSSLSLWEVCYSSLLHPQRRKERPSGRTSTVHHRIALFSSEYKITQIISQTDIVKLVMTNKSQLPEDCLRLRVLDVPGAASPTPDRCSCGCLAEPGQLSAK